MGIVKECPQDFRQTAQKCTNVNQVAKIYGVSASLVKRWIKESNFEMAHGWQSVESLGIQKHVLADISSGLTKKQLTEKYGVGTKALNRFAKSCGVQIKSAKNVHPMPPPEELFDLHITQQKSRKDLEKHYNVSGPVIDRWLTKANIEYQDSKTRRRPSKEELVDLHFNKQYTIQMLCEKYGRGWQYVKQWFKYYQIEPLHYRPRRVKANHLTDMQLKETITALHHGCGKTQKQISQQLNISDVSVGNWMDRLGIEKRDNYHPSQKSIGELELVEFVQHYFPNAHSSKSLLKNNWQIDCFVPEKNIGFEYNGLFWHCEVNRPSPSYHLQKTKFAEQQGIQIFHIYEDEWLGKQSICKSMILNKLGKTPNKIFARNTQIINVEPQQAKQFFLDNHLQGPPQSCKYVKGLVFNGTLVAAMSFGKHPRQKTGIVLTRFATIVFTNVVGGASKLFKAFIQDTQPQQVITWSDKRWSTGGLYKTLGFSHFKTLPPDYDYVKGQQRYPKQRFQKHIIGCPPDITEAQFMSQRNFYRIWNCGKEKWVWKPD